MKSTNNFVRIASTVLCLLAFAAASFAAAKPLSYPLGLAVDTKGNLYVANSGGNDILVYNPSYNQLPSKTITQNVSDPTGVAFDPYGNLWVANYGGGSGSVTEYSEGVLNASNTITNGIQGPEAIAVDGLGNVWVENGFANVTVYFPEYPNPSAPPTTLFRTITPFAPEYLVYGIALSGQAVAFGGSQVNIGNTTSELANVNVTQEVFPIAAFALATDSNGKMYAGGFDNTVDVLSNDGGVQLLIQLSFTPNGIAVDNTRGRLYISNANGSAISVYSTAGVLLHTIQ
jgi:DNA-binding beta-propeller fold protein YncE